MSAPLSSVAGKLGKLVPRLGADHDGEVIAVVRAIRKTLAGAGVDLHDLATAIDRPTVVVTTPPARPRQARAAPRPKPSPFDSELLRLVAVLRVHQTRLKPGESDFLDSMFVALSAGRQASQKQEQWLRNIDRRLQRAAGAA